MDSFTNVLRSLLQLLARLGDLVVNGIAAIELWLRGQLTAFGVPESIQAVLLIALAVVLVLAALRLFGGLIRVAVVIILLLIAIHVLLPILQH